MALSMFMHRSAALSPMFRQQVMRLVTPCSLKNNISFLCTSSALKPILAAPKVTPIYNVARDFRTSAVGTKASTALPHNEHPHDHAKLWVIEKTTTMIMFIVIPVGLMFPHKYLDVAMAVLMCAHSFWGVEACMVEYARELVVGSFVPKLAMLLVYIITAIQLGGLLYLALNGMGISQGFWALWGALDGSSPPIGPGAPGAPGVPGAPGAPGGPSKGSIKCKELGDSKPSQ